MCVNISSTKAKVKNVAKVKKILIDYDCEGIEFRLNEDSTLEAVIVKDQNQEYGEEFPAALNFDDVPDRHEYPDEDSWFDDWIEAYLEKGAEGFLALLRDLAPLLETPLLILAADMSEGDCLAKVWRVEPDKEVETLDVFIG